jgi:phosphoglycerate dehydrogenase-like enzyme
MRRVGFMGPSFALDAVGRGLGPGAEVVLIAPDPDALAHEIGGIEGLIDASTRIPIDGNVLRSAIGLRIVSLASTGSSHVDLKAAYDTGIVVRTLREDATLLAGLTPAAEHAWALVLACARSLPAAVQHVREGSWERERFPGVMLRGRTLGIVGLGRIGSRVADFGRVFGMRVLASDPGREDWPDGIERVTLRTLMAESDVVSVHVHLEAGTAGLIDRSLLELCRPTAIVINTSRGGVVDDEALLDLLECDRLGAVGLDVVVNEPPDREGRLVATARSDDRLIVTPHIGGFSPDAVLLVCRRAAEKVAEHLGFPA